MPVPATRSRTVCDHQDLVGTGLTDHAGADVDRNPGDLVLMELALADVNADPRLQLELVHATDDRLSCADRPCRAVERSEEAVACRISLLPAVAP